jgi:TPR repeat protein
MVKSLLCAALAAGAILCGVARADFSAALKDYNAGHYEQAQAQFLALAELGDCSSQFNLGAMALKGQGGAKDRASGTGWLEAAASNGCQQLVGDRLTGLRAGLSPDESRAAAAIVARYGSTALAAEGVANPRFDCRDRSGATVLSTPIPDYPASFRSERPEGIVIMALSIGTDGLARDPEILLAVPQTAFAASAVEAWLNSRFTPAQQGGQLVDSRLEAKLRFVGQSGKLTDATVFKAALPAAEAGDAGAQYVVGQAATLDSSLGITSSHAADLLIGAARAGNPQAQYWVAVQVRAAAACNPPKSSAVWLRHAADGGSASAQVLLASDLLSGTPSAAQIGEARTLLERAAAADSYYARKHAIALLAASPISTVHNPGAALSAANQLRQGEIQSDPQMFEVLAAAYAANGSFDAAVEQQETAIRKARTLAWNTRLMKERLAAYKAGRPWQGDLFAQPAGT